MKDNTQEILKDAIALVSMNENDMLDYIHSLPIVESFNSNEGTFEIDIPLEQWMKENNFHDATEWLQYMESI